MWHYFYMYLHPTFRSFVREVRRNAAVVTVIRSYHLRIKLPYIAHKYSGLTWQHSGLMWQHSGLTWQHSGLTWQQDILAMSQRQGKLPNIALIFSKICHKKFTHVHVRIQYSYWQWSCATALLHVWIYTTVQQNICQCITFFLYCCMKNSSSKYISSVM